MLGLIAFCICIRSVLVQIFKYFVDILVLTYICIETESFYFLEKFTEERCNIVYGHTLVILGSMVLYILGWWTKDMWNAIYASIISNMFIRIMMSQESK